MKEVKPGSFIYEQEFAISLDTCDAIIQMFEDHPEQQVQGITASGIDLDRKRSIDLDMGGLPHWADLDLILFNSLSEMLTDFPHQEWITGHNIGDSGYLLKRYGAGDFYKPHFDNDGERLMGRQMVVIWYLNATFDGGCTTFPGQDVEIVPKAGKAVMFPPFWTHMHEGQTVVGGTKYIATTWLSTSWQN
jgi:hypothetical protein